MARRSTASIRLPSSVHGRVYPRSGDLTTVGFLFTRAEAIAFATLVLAAAHQWETVAVNGWRGDGRIIVGTSNPGADELPS